MQSKHWKHRGSSLPMKFKRVHSAGKWWPQPFGIVKGWSRLISLSIVALKTVHIMHANWAAQERGEENWLALVRSCKTTSLVTRHKLPWLLRLNVDLKSYLTPIFFWYLFPKLKSHFRGKQYGSNECVIAAVNEYLKNQEKAFYIFWMD